MTIQESYQGWKPTVLGKVIGDGQCASLVVNNPQAYTEALFPGTSWETIFPPVGAAKQLMGDANQQYFEVIPNDHNDPNQLPMQGDIMVFDYTPQGVYTNKYDNPYGHTGICDYANANGYTLLQQNSPYSGAPVNLTNYAWNYRPCLGWLRPKVGTTPAAPASAPTPVAVPEPAPTPAQIVPPAPAPVPESTSVPTEQPAPQTTVSAAATYQTTTSTNTVQPTPGPIINQGVNMQIASKLSQFLSGKKTYIGIAAGVIYSILIYFHLAQSDQMVWTLIGGWTGISARLAIAKA